jgi:carbonic anhydrase/acetyltransferase-like protein (isoleucine patch superfamily)
MNRSLHSLAGVLPRCAPSAWVAPGAHVIGRVTLGKDVSIWFNAVLRGDVVPIHIGDRTNIQDLAMIHGSTGGRDVAVGPDVTVGHRAILHGCTIGRAVLVGMGAILLDDVEVGDHCLIAAGAVLTPRTIIPTGSLVMGSPAKVRRLLRDEEIESLYASAAGYVAAAGAYRIGNTQENADES